jgi:kinesin family member 18/19
MQGYNASVFAYGATGAGKTYTMLGTEDQPGIMMLSIEELFKSIEEYSAERDYMLKVSYVEVYNENIKDLLIDRSDGEYLDLREDAVKGVMVAGVTEIMTTNVEEIDHYIRQGNRLRTKERTDANETSSRSHAVLQITVEHKDKAHGINAEINIAKLSLIDLAGSERASNTNNRGLRLIEGANINKSLLALGNCINALCDLTKNGVNN